MRKHHSTEDPGTWAGHRSRQRGGGWSVEEPGSHLLAGLVRRRVLSCPGPARQREVVGSADHPAVRAKAE